MNTTLHQKLLLKLSLHSIKTDLYKKSIVAQNILAKHFNCHMQDHELDKIIQDTSNVENTFNVTNVSNVEDTSNVENLHDLKKSFNQLRSENIDLKLLLSKYEENNDLLNEKFHKLEKENYNLLQDVKLHTIHFKNLQMINIRLTNAIKNLQSYREYVIKLILKRKRANYKIKKLILAIKNMQSIIKHKNAIIKKINYNNNKLVFQAGKIIENNYVI